MAFGLLATLRNRHFHSLLGNLIIAFFNVLSFAILVRVLSKDDFGEWVLFIATYTVLDQVRTALLQSGIIKFYAGVTPYTARKVAGAAWYISLLVSFGYIALSTIVYFAAYGHFNETWHVFIVWLGVLTLLSLPLNFATWVLQAEHRFDRIALIRLAQNGSFLLLLGILFLAKQVSLSNVLYMYAISLAFTSVYCLLKRWTYIRTIWFRTKAHAMELYRFGRLIVGSMASSLLISYSDNMVIRTMMNPAAVAIYSIPQKFMEVIEIILRSFVATAQPTLSAAANRQDYKAVALAFCRYTGTVTIVIAPIILVLLLLTQPLIVLLAKSSYLDATDVVRIILLSAILWPIDRFIGVTLDMINKPQINFYKNFLKLILNISLDILFVWVLADIRSVALASLVNVIFAVIFGYYFVRKYLGVRLVDVIRLGWQECMLMLHKIRFKRNIQ